MNDPRLVQLLAACGMAESELESLLTSSEDASPRYRALQNPKAADELACALAVEAARSTPNRVLIWAGVDDTLLAFVVARELECEVSVVWQSEGLLCCDPEIAVGDRVLIVSACFIETSRLEALRSLVALSRRRCRRRRVLDRNGSASRRRRRRGAAAVALPATARRAMMTGLPEHVRTRADHCGSAG